MCKIKFAKISKNYEFEAGPKVINLVDLKIQLNNKYLVAKFGFDTAENEPSKV